MDSTQPFIRIGLTGGIAAGKSAVATLWEQAGVPVVDSDRLAHEALAAGTPTYAALAREFGAAVLNADGSVNRPALADRVFGPGNEARLAALNAIIHPAVRERWQQQLRRWADDPQIRIAAAAVPLLYETGAENEFDYVVVVACSAESQLTRLQAKGMTEVQARARITSQWPMPQKMDRADFVIWNDGSRRQLSAQAAAVLHRIKESNHAPQTL